MSSSVEFVIVSGVDMISLIVIVKQIDNGCNTFVDGSIWQLRNYVYCVV